MEFGLLLPHFTEHATRARLLEGARRAEELGFRSLWVRDNTYIAGWLRQHGGIVDQSGLFLEAFVTLGAVAAVTERITLGTAVLIPHRHPLKAAQSMASLSHLAERPVVMGVGLGADKNQFRTLGIPFDRRRQLVKETMDICRLAWSGEVFSYEGEIHQLRNASLSPRPVAPIPIWHGGENWETVRFCAEHCDGWFPSRIIRPRLLERLEFVHRHLDEHPRPFTFGLIPQLSLGRSADEALAAFDLEVVLAEVRRRSELPDLQVEDLEGYLLWGTAATVRRAIERFRDMGITHVVFDLRASFDRYEETLERLGQDVLPAFSGPA